MFLEATLLLTMLDLGSFFVLTFSTDFFGLFKQYAEWF